MDMTMDLEGHAKSLRKKEAHSRAVIFGDDWGPSRTRGEASKGCVVCL